MSWTRNCECTTFRAVEFSTAVIHVLKHTYLQAKTCRCASLEHCKRCSFMVYICMHSLKTCVQPMNLDVYFRLKCHVILNRQALSRCCFVPRTDGDSKSALERKGTHMDVQHTSSDQTSIRALEDRIKQLLSAIAHRYGVCFTEVSMLHTSIYAL